MRDFFITILLGSLFIPVASASNVPIFVFYKDGKIEQFNSNDIVRIETDEEIADGTPRTYQNFVLNDTVRKISVAEIDSVVFNPGNIIKPKANVIRISETDFPYIRSYNGKSIIYGNNAPESVIPPTGAKIYHDTFCELFPYGICARVDNVTRESDCILVDVTEIAPAEVFDEYFICGDYEMAVPAEALTDKGIIRAGDKRGFEYDLPLLGEDLTVKPSGFVTLRFENFVGSPLRNYYHCDIYAGYEFGLDLDYKAEDAIEREYESESRTLFRTIVGGVFAPEVSMNAFADVNASAKISYNMKRTYESHYTWTRKGNENSFKLADGEGPSKDENEAKLEIVLDGSIHLGVCTDFSLNTLFNVAGAGVRTKMGPSLEGEFSFGVLNDLTKQYDISAYAKDVITTSFLTKVETYMYYHNLNGEYREELLPFAAESKLYKRTFHLLPQFDSRCVRRNLPENDVRPSKSTPVAEIASVSDVDIPYSLPIGFQLTDKNSNTVIEEVFDDDKYRSNTSGRQGFKGALPLHSRNAKDVRVRPVIKYGDYKILGKPVDVQEGGRMSPMFFNSCNSGRYMVGGASIIGQHTKGSTTYIVGNLMPVCKPDTAFINPDDPENPKRHFTTVSFINEESGKPYGELCPIFGKWSAEINGETITMELSQDFTCTYCNEKGVMMLNKPQSGLITLTFPDNKRIVISIITISLTEMKVCLNNKTEATFKRI